MPHITEPEIVAPITIHPAFEKAGHYFDVKIVHAPVDPVTKKVTPAAMEALITPNTIALCVSAPQYCHCIVDPVEEVGKVAKRRGTSMAATTMLRHFRLDLGCSFEVSPSVFANCHFNRPPTARGRLLWRIYSSMD